MPVCILGMHRSGTSMVARLLNVAGVSLGSEADLYPAHAIDNPDGYWENLPLSRLNDDLLAALGGSWRQPPPLPTGWPTLPIIQPLIQRARDIASDFKAFPLWGWKDPRNTLTLAFWQQVFPSLQMVLCVRHPLEVALSMSSQTTTDRLFDPAEALALWTTYHQRLLASVDLDRLLVTHYDSYFYDARAEMRRIVDYMQLAVDAATVESAVQTIKPRQKHHYAPSALLASQSTAAAEYYDKLCQQAGPVYSAFRADEPYQRQRLETAATQLFEQAMTFGGQLRTASRDVERAEAYARHVEDDHRLIKEYLQHVEHSYAEITAHVHRLEAVNAEAAAYVAQLEQLLADTRQSNERDTRYALSLVEQIRRLEIKLHDLEENLRQYQEH